MKIRKDKTMIITGASTGIGKAIAKHFIEKEFNIVMNSSSESNLKSCFDELGAPENALYIVGDIGNRETGKLLVKEALKNFGTIDVLLNNAGIFQGKPFLEVQEEDLDRYWRVNVKETFFSQAVIPSMLQQGGEYYQHGDRSC